MNKKKILIIGPTLPPYNGMSVTTDLILRLATKERVSLIHLDTADRRGLSNIGKLDLTNIYLAFLHGWRFVWLLLTKNLDVVCAPISQAALPFLRDCLFLIPARIFGIKVVIHLHGGYFQESYKTKSSLMRALIRFALGKVKRVIVLGHILKGQFESIIPQDKITIVPDGHEDFMIAGNMADTPKNEKKSQQ